MCRLSLHSMQMEGHAFRTNVGKFVLECTGSHPGWQNRHSLTYALVAFWKNSAQVGVEYIYRQLYMYIQWSTVKVEYIYRQLYMYIQWSTVKVEYTYRQLYIYIQWSTVKVEYIYRQLYIYIQWSTVKIHTADLNLTGRSMISLPLVLSPISILPSPASHYALVLGRKNFGTRFKNFSVCPFFKIG
jgi:hypothetical protein